jgi:hypothetical protein
MGVGQRFAQLELQVMAAVLTRRLVTQVMDVVLTRRSVTHVVDVVHSTVKFLYYVV